MTALFLQQLFVLELLLLLIIWCFIGHFSTSAAPVGGGALNSTGLIILHMYMQQLWTPQNHPKHPKVVI